MAGHRGMVGSAICRELKRRGFRNLVLRSHTELDLTRQADVEAFFSSCSVDEVYVAAARVGGIHANDTFPAEFLYQNLTIESNLIRAAHRYNVSKLLFLGSSCIYPRNAPQPIREEYLLTGALEPTNEAYAIAKIAGIKLCESHHRQYDCDFRSIMPTNLYGPGDNYHPQNSHVIPGLLRRFHQAKTQGLNEVVVWGSGNAKREFLHVNDLASACIHVMGLESEVYWSRVNSRCSHINAGTGKDCSIRELAELISEIVGFEGEIRFDTTRPDGSPRKLLDVSLLNSLGWEAVIPLRTGLRDVYLAEMNQLNTEAA